MGVAFILAGFTLFPTYDRNSGSKSLQLMTGLSGHLYWISNYTFDVMIYTVTWIIILIPYLVYNGIGEDATCKNGTNHFHS